MRILIMLLLAFTFTACGEHTNTIYKDKIVEVPVNQEMEGLYHFEEVSNNNASGSLELLVNYENKITVKQIHKFTSQNFNGTYGIFPTVSFSNGLLNNSGVLFFSKDVNYQNTNDIEKDGTSTNITGKRYTSYSLYKDSNGLLNLVIQIYDQASNGNGGINNIVVERHFREI